MEDEIKKDEGQEEIQEGTEKSIDRMTSIELREIAKDIPGVEGVHAMKKEQLLEIIKEARGIKDEKPVKKTEKASPGKEVSVKQLKEKIVRLKTEKATAREEKDSNKVDVLRRRINRLKKQTRKVAQG